MALHRASVPWCFLSVSGSAWSFAIDSLSMWLQLGDAPAPTRQTDPTAAPSPQELAQRAAETACCAALEQPLHAPGMACTSTRPRKGHAASTVAEKGTDGFIAQRAEAMSHIGLSVLDITRIGRTRARFGSHQANIRRTRH